MVSVVAPARATASPGSGSFPQSGQHNWRRGQDNNGASLLFRHQSFPKKFRRFVNIWFPVAPTEFPLVRLCSRPATSIGTVSEKDAHSVTQTCRSNKFFKQLLASLLRKKRVKLSSILVNFPYQSPLLLSAFNADAVFVSLTSGA